MTNSRPHRQASGTWRRRHCNQCNDSFSTYERARLDQKIRILNDTGASQPFHLGKLVLSIAAAFEHDRAQQETASLPLAETIEQYLLREVTNPSTADIAAATHQTLKRYDELAALQYAAKHQLLTSIRRRGRPSIGSRSV